MNNEMNELAVKNGLPHWKCISIKSNEWWRRDDGAEYTVKFSSTGSVFDSLKELDNRFPMGSTGVQPSNLTPVNKKSQSHAKKMLLGLLERIEDDEKYIDNYGQNEWE